MVLGEDASPRVHPPRHPDGLCACAPERADRAALLRGLGLDGGHINRRTSGGRLLVLFVLSLIGLRTLLDARDGLRNALLFRAGIHHVVRAFIAALERIADVVRRFCKACALWRRVAAWSSQWSRRK